jgi:hypothetical protein
MNGPNELDYPGDAPSPAARIRRDPAIPTRKEQPLMATKRQNQANRRNARRSTGPRTAAGLSASSLNALKHGLRSQLTVIPGENEAEFQSLFDAFAGEAAPRSPRDLAAVRKIAACEWRLRRITAIETEMFTQALQQPAEEEATIDNIEAIVERLAVQQAAPPQSPLATLAARFLKGEIKHFNALARYESSLNRQYNQAWRELDSRPQPGFREVYEPAREPEAQEPEPEPHYTEPLPEVLGWKSAADRYAEAQPPIEPAASEPAQQTAQTKPIPKSDTAAKPKPPSILQCPPPEGAREFIEWARERAKLLEDFEEEEEIVNPGA